jgi:outer membrane protein
MRFATSDKLAFGAGRRVLVMVALAGAVASSARAQESSAPLTLVEALRLARAHQPALHQAESALAAAQGQSEVSRAPLLPQVNGSASYSRATAAQGPLPGSTTGSITGSLDTFPYYRFGVTASQLVWDFGRTLNQWRAAKVVADAQAQSVRAAELQVELNVRVAFFSARAAKDLVAVAKDTLANQEKHLRQIEGFVQLGSRPEIDVSQARADRANARVQLINAENNYDVARAQLNLAMGVERPVDYGLSDDTLGAVDAEQTAVNALVDEAGKTRPELANLRLLAIGRELSLKAARDAHYPSLGFATGLNETGPGLDRLTWVWTGALTLSVPIFQGGGISAQVRVATALLAGAQAQVDATRQQIRLEIEQARLGIRAAQALGAASEDALTNAQDRLRLAEGRYQAGVGNIIELGDAQLAQTAAAAQRVQADYQLFTARAQLLKALGRD